MSPLRTALADYLAGRRALGFKLERAEKLLGQFIAYLEERGAERVTVEHALAWALLPGGGDAWHSLRLSAVRCFARTCTASIHPTRCRAPRSSAPARPAPPPTSTPQSRSPR